MTMYFKCIKDCTFRGRLHAVGETIPVSEKMFKFEKKKGDKDIKDDTNKVIATVPVSPLISYFVEVGVHETDDEMAKLKARVAELEAKLGSKSKSKKEEKK